MAEKALIPAAAVASIVAYIYRGEPDLFAKHLAEKPVFQFAAVVTALVPILAYLYRDDPLLSQSNRSDKSVPRIGGATPFLGDLVTLGKYLDHGLYEFLEEQFIKTSNKTFVVKAPFSPIDFQINDPEILEFVLKTKFTSFDKGPNFQLNFHDFLGKGIFNSDGEQWKPQRKVAANIFNVKNFKEYVDHVFTEEMVTMKKVLNDFVKSGESFNLEELFYKFTFDSFARIAFGVDFGTMLSKEKEPFTVAFDDVKDRCALRFFNPFWQTTEYFTGEHTKQKMQVKQLRTFAQKIIETRRKSTKAPATDDLLSLLMKTKNEDGSDIDNEMLIDYVLNIMIAGRDTTATALAWSFFMLHKNPETLTTLLKEIGTGKNSSPPTYEQMKTKLPYANAVFHETLRLYPSVPLNKKSANQDITLPDGTFVPSGAVVTWSPYVMGRTPAIWGPDAKAFRPERWIEMEKQVSNFDYPVFHAGPRICLGKQMAELEGVFVLVELVRNYTFQIVNEESVKYKFSVGLPMKNGLSVKVALRT